MKKFLKSLGLLCLALVLGLSCFACGANKEKVKVINIKLTEEEYAFGVNKEDTALKQQLNTYISQMKTDGSMDSIMDKYFAGEEVTGITSATYDASKDQLVIATNAEFAPFEYKLGNKFAGIDIEIAKAIADKMGKELVIYDMDFDAVVTAVQNKTNGAQVAMAGLTVTEDRKASIDFTDTYYQASQMIIVKESDTTFNNCKTKEDVENILNNLKNKKVGYQSGTTGEYYVNGNSDYAGFKNINGVGFSNAALAVQDVLNGNCDFVIVDEMPAKTIVKSFNK